MTIPPSRYGPRVRPILQRIGLYTLILGVCVSEPVAAFFCFSFGGRGHGSRPPVWTPMPSMPAPAFYPGLHAPGYSPSPEFSSPALRPPRSSPRNPWRVPWEDRAQPVKQPALEAPAK